MIYVLEGVDGSGKTTLAQELVRRFDGQILHGSFNKDWDIFEYHLGMMEAAKILEKSGYGAIVIDRWAPSEYAYGNVFRSGPSYDAFKLVNDQPKDIAWVYCKNNDPVNRHQQNKKTRYEMYSDVSKVLEEYEYFIGQTKHLGWKTFNFDEETLDQFIRRIQGD